MRFDDPIGSGGESLEAINVEIVNASALESIEVSPAAQASGAAQAVSMRPGAEAPVDQAEMQQQSESNKALPSATEEALLKSDGQDDPNPELRTADNVSSRENAVIADRETQADPERSPQKEVERDEGKAQVRQNAQDALMAGQAASRAAEASIAASAAAQATEGQMARYAMLVRAALGAARPTHTGRRGRTIVRFLVNEAGSVSYASVTTSSGYVELDEAALSSVRKSSFPPPPPELSEGQRQFLVPFDFK